ncbi:alpha/beta hydrolase [Alkalilacustris brevis]|uniref:alpha/beta hydrolase n=1 Tax=Alkalilacustris brevis TaxID=2026338 RepID=UPI0012D2C724|nr:alpha/beta hydrolase [Alkalilacustris brevis]
MAASLASPQATHAQSPTLPLSAEPHSTAALPPGEAFLAFDRFLALLPEAPESAFALAEHVLAMSDTADLRLALAEAALGAGHPAQALACLQNVAARLPPQDARHTQAMALEIAAHLALGDAARAMARAEMRYKSVRARLGDYSPALGAELDALAALAAENGLTAPPLIAEERARLSAQPRSLPTPDDPHAVTVWYGTSRAATGAADPARAYGSDVGPLETGRLVVTIPPGHRTGVIERPAAWSFTGRPDPRSHVVLAELEVLTRDAFAAGCCGAEDRLLFVHGFNVSFEAGALRAAQLAFDLEFRGTPMYFSWPSQGTVLGYLTDANGVFASRPALVEFLELATRGEGQLHIIAHSMGNRYLLEALEIFLRDHPDRRIGQLILGAPDVDQSELQVRLPILRDRAERVTLYASSGDRALMASQRVNGRPRAGDMAGAPLGLAGLDTIDASGMQADMLGHSYFGMAPPVLADILGMVRLNRPPPERCSTLPGEAASLWLLRDDGCGLEELRVVEDLLRLHGDEAVATARDRAGQAPGGDADFWQAVLLLLETQG